MNLKLVNRLCIKCIFFVCFFVFSHESMASYVLPEFSIKTKADLDNSTIELILFKSRSQILKRDEVKHILTNEEKCKLAAILNASRYDRNDSMYWNGPILKEYEEIGYINVSSSSGIHSRYWIEVTKNYKNWSLTHNKEAFSSSNAGLYFDETEAIENFVNFKRVENLSYLMIPCIRWIIYLIFFIIAFVFLKRKFLRRKTKRVRCGVKIK